jgi:hypothetical protein
MWDLWCTKRHWDRFSSEFFGFPWQHHHATRAPYSYIIIWEKNNRSVRFQILTAASMEFRVFWEVAPYSHLEVDLMMEAVGTSETPESFNVTIRRYIPEDSTSTIIGPLVTAVRRHSFTPLTKKKCKLCY